MGSNLNNYKFLKEKDLDVIEQTNSLMSVNSRVNSFLRAGYYESIFHKYSNAICDRLECKEGDKIFVAKLLLPSDVAIKKNKESEWEEAYLIESDLDMFSVLILGYWKVVTNKTFSDIHLI